jgi:hypothetical protein
MTDFLTGLLNRTLERTPVLQRRRLSVFEPTPGMPRLAAMPPESLWPRVREQEIADQESTEFQAPPAFHPTDPTLRRPIRARSVSPLQEDEVPSSVRPLLPTTPAVGEVQRETRHDSVVPPPKQKTVKREAAAPPLSVTEPLVENETENPRPVIRSGHPQSPSSEPPITALSSVAPPARSLVTPPIEPDQRIENRARRHTTQERQVEGIPAKPTQAVVQPIAASSFLAPSARPLVSPPVDPDRSTETRAHRNEQEVENPRSATRSLRSQAPSDEPPIASSSLLAPRARSLAAPSVESGQGTESRVYRPVAQERRTKGVAAKPTQAVVQPVLLPLPRPAPVSSRPRPLTIREPAPVAPTIQVTIGRIEVRATAPTAPTRAVRSAAPKLSLEDYLRSRGGGSK